MEYSPENAIPYVSRVDAGTLELVIEEHRSRGRQQRRSGAVGRGRVDARTACQPPPAAAVCLAAKDAAFAFIAQTAA